MRTMAEEPTAVVSVSCGSSHTVALLANGAVVSFGKGEDGQLGHGDAVNSAQPRAITGLAGRGVTTVVCGAEYTAAVSRGGRQVYTWGWGDFGRLGHGSAADCFAPEPVAALAGIAVRRVACGDAHTLVVADDGALYTFGRNQNGQLGLGTTLDAFTPQRVEGGLAGAPVACAAAGAEHSVVATADGRVFSFGWGKYGCLGDGTREDRHAPTLTLGLEGATIREVACGWRHSIAVTDAHALYTFGWGKFGQIGHGDTEDRLTAAEVPALKGRAIACVAGGWRHTVAVDDAGRCYAWGWGKFGQLGLGGDRSDRRSPEPVGGALVGRRVTQVACGWRHTVAVTDDGALWAWGRGAHYQLGTGDDADRDVPTLVPAASFAAACSGEGAAGGAGAAAAAPAGAGGAVDGGGSSRFALVPEEDDGGAGLMGAGGGGGGGGGAQNGSGEEAARKKARLAPNNDDSDAAVPDS